MSRIPFSKTTTDSTLGVFSKKKKLDLRDFTTGKSIKTAPSLTRSVGSGVAGAATAGTFSSLTNAMSTGIIGSLNKNLSSVGLSLGSLAVGLYNARKAKKAAKKAERRAKEYNVRAVHRSAEAAKFMRTRGMDAIEYRDITGSLPQDLSPDVLNSLAKGSLEYDISKHVGTDRSTYDLGN